MSTNREPVRAPHVHCIQPKTSARLLDIFEELACLFGKLGKLGGYALTNKRANTPQATITIAKASEEPRNISKFVRNNSR